MKDPKTMEQKQIKNQCAYLRRDGTYCPEERMDDSSYCFWHNSDAPKDGEDIKAKLEAKVKKDPNCEGYRLEKIDLNDVWLTETNFNNAIFRRANLSKGHLFGISLKGADLFKANVSGANLRHAYLNEANLMGTKFENTKLENVDWGKDNIVLQEIQAELALRQGQRDVAKTKFKDAEEIYVTLKNHFDAIGQSKSVGKFFYREMIAQRKQQPLFSARRVFMKLADVSCGYGEKVLNIILFSVFVILINALFFSFSGVTDGENFYRISLDNGIIGNIKTYLLMAYYSTVTYATLGYGDLLPASPISKLIASVETLTGAFLMALFVVTIHKNMMSR